MPKGTDLQYERETTILFNEAEDDAMVWSASPTFQRKMERLGIQPTRIGQRERGAFSAWYAVPQRWIKIRKPQLRTYTEEQRAEMGRRMKIRRENPSNG